MRKLISWFYIRRYLVKRELILRQVERVVFDYKERNLYDKYTDVLNILVNQDKEG